MADKTILQQYAADPVTFPIPDETKLIFGVETESLAEPQGIQYAQIQAAVRQSTMTIGDLANATNYATAESGDIEAGASGVFWSSTGWKTTRNGVFVAVADYAYTIPASDSFGYFFAFPINIAQQPTTKRKNTLAIELAGSVIATDDREHDNMVEQASETYRLRCVSRPFNWDTSDLLRVYVKGYQWPTPGDIVSWAKDSALVSFVRLNQEMA